LIGYLYDVLKEYQEDEGAIPEDPNRRYFAELRELTAEKWLDG
jgi:hypothetical protein